MRQDREIAGCESGPTVGGLDARSRPYSGPAGKTATDCGENGRVSLPGNYSPPPKYMLEAATMAPAKNDTAETRWLLRFGMTHGVWGSADAVVGTVLLDPVPDLVVRQSSIDGWFY